MSFQLSDLWSPMTDLSSAQRKVSDYVTSASVIGLAAVIALTCGPAAQAQGRMTNQGYGIPDSRTVPSQAPVAPAPAPAPQYTPQPQIQYGVFSATGPLPQGRVNVSIDGSFEHGQILGYEVYIQDNGTYGNDQIVVLGPEGKEQIWVNCNVTEEWKSFGPNTEQFIHSVASQWCSWDS